METFNEAQARVARVDLRIVFLEMDQRRAWRMRFDNGVEIKLGREQLLARLQRFVDIYPRVLAQRAGSIATVDMRYVNGFAVRWLESDEGVTRRSGRGGSTTTRAARVESPRQVEAG